MRVLLVDDEQKFVTFLATRLRLRGIDADCVFSGEAAVERVSSSGYDVVVLDVKMPGLGGIELRRRLESLRGGMKFIFLTGHGSEGDFQVGSAEASFYLPKPLKIEDLIAVLHQAVAGRARPSEDGR